MNKLQILLLCVAIFGMIIFLYGNINLNKMDKITKKVITDCFDYRGNKVLEMKCEKEVYVGGKESNLLIGITTFGVMLILFGIAGSLVTGERTTK